MVDVFDSLTQEDIMVDTKPPPQPTTRDVFDSFALEDFGIDTIPAVKQPNPISAPVETQPDVFSSFTADDVFSSPKPTEDEPSFVKDVIVKTGADFAKAVVPYLKYVDPSERDEFMKLDKQHQVRALLLENLEAVTEIGFGVAEKTIGPPLKAFLKLKFPKTYAKLTKSIGKAKVPEKPPAAVVDDAVLDTTPKPELPKYAGSINLQRQQISDQAKLMELERFEATGKKVVISHEETITEAEKILKEFKANPVEFEKRIAEIKAGRTPTTPEELAHRITNATNAENFKQASIDLRDGKISLEDFKKLEDNVRSHQIDVTDPLASEAGRRLNMYNIEVGKNRAMKAVGALKKGMNQRQINDLAKLDLDDPMSVDRFVKNLPTPKLKDFFYEYWYNSILSGIPTHVVNVASNTLWLATQVPHRALSGVFDAAISSYKGVARTRYMSEVFPMLAGFKGGMRKAGKAGWEMLKTGEIKEFETKWAKDMGSALGAFERSNNAAVRNIGKYLTVPTKALRGMDVFFNSLAYDGQMGAIALRAAKNKGLKGDALKDFTQKFIANPSNAAHKEALEFSKYATFMDEPGKIGQALLSARSVGSQFGEPARMIIPFVRTIGNLLKRGIEMTPGVGLGLAKGQNPADVIAKQLEGAIVAFTVYSKAASGEIELVGAAPEKKSERELFYRQGKKPWSIGIGPEGNKTYIQYRRVEPFNTIIASVAIALEKVKTAKDDEGLEEIAGDLVSSFADNYIDSSYMQGVTQMLDRYGSQKGMLSRTAAGLVPYSGFLRSITRAAEVYEEGTAKLKDAKPKKGESFVSSTKKAIANMVPFANRIPFLPELPVKVELWGNEVELEGGIFRQWLPYKWSKGKNDPVENFLEELGQYPGQPSQTMKVGGEDLVLDDDIYRNYIIDSGMSAKKRLDFLVKTPEWKRRLKTERGRKALETSIEKIMNSSRRKSRGRAIAEQRRKPTERKIPLISSLDKDVIKRIPEETIEAYLNRISV